MLMHAQVGAVYTDCIQAYGRVVRDMLVHSIIGIAFTAYTTHDICCCIPLPICAITGVAEKVCS
jgi:hypothetical protein